jgi:hypothetical protein
MNTSRRICCHAANAFRPATALRSVFFEPIGIRFASKISSEVPLEFDIGQQQNQTRNRTPRELASKNRIVYRPLERQENDLAQVLDDVAIDDKQQTTEILVDGEESRGHQTTLGTGVPQEPAVDDRNVPTTLEKRESVAQASDDVTIDGEQQLVEGGDEELGKEFLKQKIRINAYVEATEEHDVSSSRHVPKERAELVGVDSQTQYGINDTATFRSPKLAEIAKKKLAGQTEEVLEYEGQYVKQIVRGRQDANAKNLPWLHGLDQSKEISRYQRYVCIRTWIWQHKTYRTTGWALKYTL